MLSRRLRQPVGLWSRAALSNRTASTALAAEPVEVKARRKYEYKSLTEGRPGVFASQLNDFVGERLGVTGIYTLGIGVYLTAFSKEMLLFNAETALVVPHCTVLYILMSKAAEFFGKDAEMMNYYQFNRLYNRKEKVIDILQTGITAANDVEKEVSVRTDVFDVLRSNNAMYRDTLYRERVAAVKTEVMKRLQHQAELEAARRRIKQNHMINWIEREVVKDIATKLDRQAVMTSCLEELKGAVDAAAKERASA